MSSDSERMDPSLDRRMRHPVHVPPCVSCALEKDCQGSSPPSHEVGYSSNFRLVSAFSLAAKLRQY